MIDDLKHYNDRYYTGKFGLTGSSQEAFGTPNVIQMEIKKYLRDFYKNADLVANVTLPFMEDVLKLYLWNMKPVVFCWSG